MLRAVPSCLYVLHALTIAWSTGIEPQRLQDLSRNTFVVYRFGTHATVVDIRSDTCLGDQLAVDRFMCTSIANVNGEYQYHP